MKITFYALRELHLPILLPVLQELQKNYSFELSITAPPFLAGTPDWPEEGISQKTIQSLQNQGIFFLGEPETKRQFDCVVTADACYDRVEAWGPVICLGHGTISKNIFYIDQPTCFRENFASLMCVPGPYYLKCFGDVVKTSLIDTGFSKMDELAQDLTPKKLKTWANINFSLSKTTILYAPTFNPELTSLEMLWNQWEQLNTSQFQVLVKLHGATPETWREKMRSLCQKNSSFYYVEDQNITPWMIYADLMISDFSSAYLEFMATKKPVLLIENPQLKSSPFWNPKTIECIAQDFCYKISNPTYIHNQLSEIIKHDHQKSDRIHFIQNIFSPLDGQNTHRIAKTITNFCHNKNQFIPQYIKPLNILLPEKIHSADMIQNNLERLEFPYKLYSQAPTSLFPNAQTWTNSPEEGDFVILNSQSLLPWDWDRIWHLSRTFATTPGLYVPFLATAQENSPQDIKPLIDPSNQIDFKSLQKYCKYQYIRNCLHCSSISPEIVFISHELPSKIIPLLWKNASHQKEWDFAIKNLHSEGLFIGVNASLLTI